jgi:hypothetical protein
MKINSWLTGTAAAAAVGLTVAMSAPASAITFGASCQADFVAAAGAQSGTGDYSSVCSGGGTLATLISSLDGDRGNAANWSVMGGSYGIFDLSNFSDGDTSATFLIHIAANNHEFGWSGASGSNKTVILPSTDAADIGDVVLFEPTEDPFLFYATNTTNNQKGNTFFSDRALNGFAGVDNFVHFAILQGNFFGDRIEYLIAVEDQVTGCDPQQLPVGAGGCGIQDDDFNDAGILVQVVPEPATIAVFGAGLLGLGLYRRRRA